MMTPSTFSERPHRKTANREMNIIPDRRSYVLIANVLNAVPLLQNRQFLVVAKHLPTSNIQREWVK